MNILKVKLLIYYELVYLKLCFNIINVHLLLLLQQENKYFMHLDNSEMIILKFTLFLLL